MLVVLTETRPSDFPSEETVCGLNWAELIRFQPVRSWFSLCVEQILTTIHLTFKLKIDNQKLERRFSQNCLLSTEGCVLVDVIWAAGRSGAVRQNMSPVICPSSRVQIWEISSIKRGCRSAETYSFVSDSSVNRLCVRPPGYFGVPAAQHSPARPGPLPGLPEAQQLRRPDQGPGVPADPQHALSHPHPRQRQRLQVRLLGDREVELCTAETHSQ